MSHWRWFPCRTFYKKEILSWTYMRNSSCFLFVQLRFVLHQSDCFLIKKFLKWFGTDMKTRLDTASQSSFFKTHRHFFVSHGGLNWFLICLDEYCTLWFKTTTTSNTYLCVQNLALLNSLKIFKSFLIANANSLSEFAHKCITNAIQPYLMTGCRGSPCQT